MFKFTASLYWSRRETILFLERLESYISSGLSIDRSLHIIEEDSSKKQKVSVRSMRLSVESGRSLGDSLKGTLKLPPTILGLISHGESSGRLSQSLLSGRVLLEHSEELKKKLGTALAYPCIIGIFALILTLGLVRGIMPQITPMLLGLHVPLPLITRAVIAFSQGFIAYGVYAVFGIILFCFVLVLSYKKSWRIRYIAHYILICLPIIGRLSIDHTLSLFLQSCGSLIETGSPARAAYAKSVAAIQLLPLGSKFLSKSGDLGRGAPLSSAFRENKVPSFIPSLLSAGEMSGMLGASMIRAAVILDKDMDHSLKRLTSLIEPVMMAGMGIVVGVVALSIMMPIYDISKVLQK